MQASLFMIFLINKYIVFLKSPKNLQFLYYSYINIYIFNDVVKCECIEFSCEHDP